MMLGSKLPIALIATITVLVILCLEEASGHKRPRNCIVSLWSHWSHCSYSCGANGVQTHRRRVVRPAKYGGKCPPLQEGRPCNRFCLNGGTLRYNSCHCRVGYGGACCQNAVIVSECNRYTPLNDADRSVKYVASAANGKCDNNLRTGWYRFVGAAGTKIPEKAPAMYSCGTHAPGWLRGRHPTVHDGKVSRFVCFNWSNNSCLWESRVYVTNCGSYYVYYLKKPPLCRLRYCVEAGVNSHWSSWGTWSGCVGNCGTGKQSRKRTCTSPSPSNGGASCHGSTTQFRSCLLKPCAVDGRWSTWGNWGRCSKTCGLAGRQYRKRSCTNPPPSNSGRQCSGRNREYKSCNINSCGVDGGWSTWGNWWRCSRTCGTGQQYRKRYCVNPRPSNGGKTCNGAGAEHRRCNTHSCAVDGRWSPWGKWCPCSKTCGTGKQNRKRICNNPAPSSGGKPCSGDGAEYRKCKTQSCPVDGRWSPWGNWWPCPKTCGTGEQYRKRYCNNPRPDVGGKTCSGLGIEYRKCNTHSCAVDGRWSPWGKWCPCSKTCGTGKQDRKRICNNPAPSSGGKPCSGDGAEYRKCKTQSCPVDGRWSPWGNWWSCSKTCGTGEQYRKRYCNNPRPDVGGKKCSGLGIEYRKCNTHSCQVHGEWATWGAWQPCPKTCGNGQQYRVRTCTKPVPANDGKPCIGLEKEYRPCNQHSCSVHGGWASWGTWISCSKTCGTGQQHRERTCTKPPPSNGGKLCIGIGKESRNCNTKPCQVVINGGWGAWSSWSGCSVTCGTGDALRARQCNNPPPGPGGKFCQGQSVGRQSCTEKPCAAMSQDKGQVPDS